MRKMVGGIIAVCFVQIGFQLYTVVERTNDTFAAVSGAVPAREWQAPVADVEDAFQASAIVEDLYVAPFRPYRAAPVRPRTRSRELTARTAPKVLFPTVVIQIPPQESYEFTAYETPGRVPVAQPQLPAARPPSTKIAEPKKTSTLKKIVKKPYDFLKFVASKLN